MLKTGPILVTGGAGFIGSHTLRALLDQGRSAIALDDLSTGFSYAVPQGVTLIEGNAGDIPLLERVITENKITSVIHFAGCLSVTESVTDPKRYFENNYGVSSRLLVASARLGIKHFIFSSSCSVYGSPKAQEVDEEAATEPVSPYGRSKLMVEWFLRDLATAGQLAMNHVILRYFNVAGASVQGGLGQNSLNSTQLVKIAAEAACGRRPFVSVLGTDYPTPDGTCIRDYVHVDDLADAHILALRYLEGGGTNTTLNCGYGRGFSVREVIAAMKRVSGVDFPVRSGPRREGDSVAVWANPARIQKILGWKPSYADLDTICRTSFEWERQRGAAPQPRA